VAFLCLLLLAKKTPVTQIVTANVPINVAISSKIPQTCPLPQTELNDSLEEHWVHTSVVLQQQLAEGEGNS
jgi:hypothetical protein